jgi:hypothetical protein
MRWVPGVGVVWESGVQRQIKATHDTFNAQTRAWRLYADGTESGSSPLQAENTTDDLDVTSGDVQFHLRYSVQENGSGTASGAATDDWQLQFNIDTLGWNPVTAASTGIIADTGATPSDTSATTNRSTNGISDGTGTFIASEVEAGNGEITDWQLTGDNFTEMLFCLKAVSAGLSGGESIDFRLLYNGSPTVSIDNDVTPNVTISKTTDFPITPPQGDLTLSTTAPTVDATSTDFSTLWVAPASFLSTPPEFLDMIRMIPSSFTYSQTEAVASTTPFTPVIKGFRFYDDGTESGAVASQAQDTNDSRSEASEAVFHLRFQIKNDGGTGSADPDTDWDLEMSVNSGAWKDVPNDGDTSDVVAFYTLSGLVNGTATTERLSGGTGTWVSGLALETFGLGLDKPLASGEYTEHVFGMTINAAQATPGDTVDFRTKYREDGGSWVSVTDTDVGVPRLTTAA